MPPCLFCLTLHKTLTYCSHVASYENYVALWYGLVRVFLLCECDLKKAGWNKNPNGWFAALDVSSRKCQRSRHLIIMNNRGAAFYFLFFFYFLFLLVVCRLWGLVCVLHGVSALRSGTSDGALFPWFSFMEWQGWCWMMDGMPEVGGWR